MNTNININPWPYYEQDEIDAVTKVLQSGKVNQWTGSEVKLFEQEFADYHSVKHAIAVANGTVALELALKGLGIGEGDEVIVPSHTFLATASSVVAVGAVPVVADIELYTNIISADTIKPLINAKTKAIIVVHLAGLPCDMDSILVLAEQHNLMVIEDCAQAHGAEYHGKKVGSLGDVAAFSFCQDKIISTGGEGGMVITNNTELYKKMWSYKDHGKDYELVFNTEHPPGFRWLHTTFGTNWRMTEMQATIGRLQLSKLDNWLAIRKCNRDILVHYIEQTELLIAPVVPEHIKHANYKLYCFVNESRLHPDWSRDHIMLELNKVGVPCTVGGCSQIYLERAFERFPQDREFPNATQLAKVSLMFMVHHTITAEQIDCIGQKLLEVVNQATA
jgi:dTDP-4-amino-4,6-dideoxygalactose transaminase